MLSQLIHSCIAKLHDISIRVWSITADGLATNISEFKSLGCKISGCKPENMQTYFVHPSTNFPVYVILDPCHMIKLARNVLAEKHLSSNSGRICWQYLKELNILQTDIGFNFANKITGAHINFKNKKMNVALTTQTLSTGTALEFLCELEEPKFLGAEAVIEFIRYIDRAFYQLNSRNPFGKGYKIPLSLSNIGWVTKVFEETISYLENLKIDNLPALKTPRKMFAQGFIVTMKSILLMGKEFID